MKIYFFYAIVCVVKQTYGKRLAAAIKLRSLKQAELAKELNITQATASKIINGTQYLDFDLAVKACEVLKISLDWLAYGSEQEANPPFYRNPERQRIEYLMSIIKEAEYPLVIVAMEEIIEIRLKDVPAAESEKPGLMDIATEKKPSYKPSNKDG